jgi:predicted nucleic acid-binding Zn ribbon protein
MARRRDEPDDDGDEFDPEDAEFDYVPEEHLETTVECPYCGREIHEDAQRCPYCEQYISEEDAPPRRKPWWIIVGVVVCLYIVWRWLF